MLINMLQTHERIKVIKNSKTTKFYCLLSLGDSFWVGCCDGTILVYNSNDYKKSYELKGHHPTGVPVRALTSCERIIQSKRKGRSTMQIICSGDAEGNVVLWHKKRKHKPKTKQMVKLGMAVGSLAIFHEKLCVGTEQNIFLVRLEVSYCVCWEVFLIITVVTCCTGVERSFTISNWATASG